MLFVSWTEISAQGIDYTVEWAAAEDAKQIQAAVKNTKKNSACVRDLEADSTFYLRVRAHILFPGETHNKNALFTQITSDWLEAQTLFEVHPVEGETLSVDPLGKQRGKCTQCRCRNFLLPLFSCMQRLEDVLCRRCGCSCTSHVELETGKSSRADRARSQ